jgi:hypothetical protein
MLKPGNPTVWLALSIDLSSSDDKETVLHELGYALGLK